MLGLSPILVTLGLIAGLARGGRISNISIGQFRAPWLVASGVLLQIAGTVAAVAWTGGGRAAYIWFLGASFVLLICFAVVNHRLPGVLLVGAGLVMNLTVILLNSGMPVSARAAHAAGLTRSDYLESSVKHRPMTSGTAAGFLGDTIPVPVLRKVISPGDVLIGAGLFVMVQGLVRYRPKRKLQHARGTAV